MTMPPRSIVNDQQKIEQAASHLLSAGFECRVLDMDTIQFCRSDMNVECFYERYEDSGSVSVLLFGNYPKEENGEPVRHNIIWYAEQDSSIGENDKPKVSDSSLERVLAGIQLTKLYPEKFLSARYLVACHEVNKTEWGSKPVDLDLPNV